MVFLERKLLNFEPVEQYSPLNSEKKPPLQTHLDESQRQAAG